MTSPSIMPTPDVLIFDEIILWLRWLKNQYQKIEKLELVGGVPSNLIFIML